MCGASACGGETPAQASGSRSRAEATSEALPGNPKPGSGKLTTGASVRLLTPAAVHRGVARTATLEVNLPWTGLTTVSVSLISVTSKRSITIGSAKTVVQYHRTARLSVPLMSSTARALASCAKSEVVALATGPAGQQTSGGAAVQMAPPQCGNFFAPTSVWNTPLTPNAPLDPKSAAITASLLNEVAKEDAEHFYPTVNTKSDSVPIFTVASSQARVSVILDNRDAYANGLRATLRAGVPIPRGAQPAAGGDHHMVVWQPGTNTMWELWRATQVDGQWHAAFGGRINDASRSSGAFFSSSGIELGATGSSLALAGGLMTLTEVSRGQIGHALAFAVVAARRGVWALPASRSDGYDKSPTAVPEGAHFRLPASLNISALHLPPFVAMMARAVQRYGMIVRDQAASVAFYAEDPTPEAYNPYPELLGSNPNMLAKFPWRDLQLLKMNLRTYEGKKVPDS
jgi:hypothetical protein